MTILYLGPNAFQVKLFLAFTVRNYISQFFIQFFDLFCRWSLTLSVKPLYKYMREEGEEEKIAWEGNLYISQTVTVSVMYLSKQQQQQQKLLYRYKYEISVTLH